MGAKVHNEMASKAYALVARLKETNRDCAGEFRSLARSFPSMIQVNGLGCTIAYLYSKKKMGNAFWYLYKEIDEWTKKSLEVKEENGKELELADRISQFNNMEYRLYTNEVMNLCLWIKRFAEGMLGEQTDIGKTTEQ